MANLSINEVIYLHGLGSSPASLKARHLEKILAPLHCRFFAPDLNLPTFETLSPVEILKEILHRVTAGSEKIALIGSSFGALMALHSFRFAPVRRKVSHLVLLAPAFRIFESPRLGGENIRRWKETGFLPFFHYASGAERKLPLSFYEELLAIPDPCVPQDTPILIFHGVDDDVIRCDLSKEFASRHPNVTLELVNSGHELYNVLEYIGREVVGFLGGQANAICDQ